jgi:hypothetical protein
MSGNVRYKVLRIRERGCFYTFTLRPRVGLAAAWAMSGLVSFS